MVRAGASDSCATLPETPNDTGSVARVAGLKTAGARGTSAWRAAGHL